MQCVWNIASSLQYFGRSTKMDDSVACRVLQTSVVSSSTQEILLTKYLVKVLETLWKTLYKHRKF